MSELTQQQVDEQLENFDAQRSFPYRGTAHVRAVTPTWIRQVSTALSRKYGVSIKPGKNWAMNIEKGTLIYVENQLQALDQDTVLGLLLHEVGHFLHSDHHWTDKNKEFKMDPQRMHLIVNAIEDLRINETMSRSYQGSRALIQAMDELSGADRVNDLRFMSSDIKKNVQNDNSRFASHRYTIEDYRKKFSLTEDMEILLIVLNKVNGTWKSRYDSDYYDPLVIETSNEIISRVRLHDIMQAKDTTTVATFASTDVVPLLKAFHQVKEGKGKKQQAQQKQSGSGEESEDSESDSSSEDKDSCLDEDTETPDYTEDPFEKEPSDSADSGDADSGDADSGDADSGDADASKSSSDTRSDGMNSKEWQNDIIDKIKRAISRDRVNPDEDMRTDPFEKNTKKHRSTNDYEQHRDVALVLAQSKSVVNQFKNALVPIFKDNHALREVSHQRSGRLDMRKLVRYYTAQDTKLFKRPVRVDDKSYSVALMTDCSGSMNWERTKGAMTALVAFAETLQALKIRYSIGFFADHTDIGKTFGERKMNSRNVTSSACGNGGNTYPRELIAKMLVKDLTKEESTVKMAIILTDGEWPGYDQLALKSYAKKNPKTLIYIVALAMHPAEVVRLNQDFATNILKNISIVSADTPEEVLGKYLQIAKKQLLVK
jgi:hypothetical protein